VWSVGAVVVTAGVMLRLHSRSELWLDEALSVNIARVPLDELTDVLRHDGSPPLYYLLLRAWTAVFGTGNTAVRLLSGLFSIATLPLAWFAGRRLGGRGCAFASLVLFASSPFAVRYATEARMYALVQLLVLAGLLALRRALERPSPGRLAVVTMLSGLLLLVHYWSIYLLATVGVVLVVLARGRERRRAARRALVAMAAGGLLFVPWAPSFLYQSANTGTPWGERASPVHASLAALFDIGGGPRTPAATLSVMLLLLVALGIFGRGVDSRRVELDLAVRPEGRAETAVAAGTMALGLTASRLLDTAFATRYVSIVFPLVLLLAARGTRTFLDRRVRTGVLGVAVALGLVTSLLNGLSSRTQAGEVAAYIAERGRPGDVVIYCPDQLGPSVSRLLSTGYRQLPFPAGDPRFVDWVGYERRNRRSHPFAFARRAVNLAGPEHNVWLVWSGGYRTYGRKCEQLSDTLARRRPEASIVFETRPPPSVLERMILTRFPPRPLDGEAPTPAPSR
jgi:mannosyltransferase